MAPRSYLPLLALLALIALRPGPAAGQSTPYVPVLDPAYDDLDALVSAGLVREIVVGERPHSRAAFLRFVREADARMDEGPYSDRLREAWERLDRRFGAEIEDAFRVRPTPVRADAALADSPYRALRSGADDQIDGALNPLLQRNGGRVLADGGTLALEAGLTLQGPVAGEVSPRAYLVVPGGPAEADVQVDVLAAYARKVLGPVALEVGRTPLTWGHGSRGGIMLSDNARGLDMIRVAGDRPIRLPGPFAGLGLWRASLALGTMGDDRDTPGAKAVLTHLGWRPSRYVEVGFNYINVQGGEGAPDASFGDRLRDYLLFPRTDPDPDNPGGLFIISEKVIGVDLRLSVPSIRSALYANFLTTDDRGLFQQPARGYWEDAIWLVGAEVGDLGPGGRLSTTLEWRHAGARAHAHGQFTSGLTLDDRVMGDPLGPNASGVTGGVDWTGRSHRVRVRGAWERYSGDRLDWDEVVEPDGGVTSTPWYVVSDNPDEIRRRVVVEYLRFPGSGRFETSVRVGYEQVDRFGYDGDDRDNLLLQATVRSFW